MPYLSNISAIAAKNGWLKSEKNQCFVSNLVSMAHSLHPGDFPTGARTAVDIMPMSLVSPQKPMDLHGGSPMATGGNSNQKTNKNQKKPIKITTVYRYIYIHSFPYLCLVVFRMFPSKLKLQLPPFV